MILSDLEIRKYFTAECAMIEPFNEERLQGASYDLSMSNHIAFFKKQMRPIDLSNQSQIDLGYDLVDLPKDGCVLNPGEYVLATVAEKITIPSTLCAHIRPRTRFTRLGILTSAQHCNPGYSGILQIGIYNASPNAVVLKPGLRIAQIIFEELSSEPSKEKQYQNKQDSAYMNEQKFKGAIFDEKELSPNARALYEKIINSD